MNTIINVLHTVEEVLYSNLSGCISAALSAVISGLFTLIPKLWTPKQDWLAIYRTSHTDTNYFFILMGGIITLIVCLIPSMFICAYIQQGLQIPYDSKSFMVAELLISLVIACALTELAIRHIGKLRLKFLGNKKKRIFLYIPIAYFAIPVLYQTIFGKNTVVITVIAIALCLIEVIGIINTETNYTCYKYKKAVFYLEDGEKIICNDISKLKKKRNIMRLENENGSICFRYSDIKRVDYSGEKAILLNSFSGKP